MSLMHVVSSHRRGGGGIKVPKEARSHDMYLSHPIALHSV